MALPGRERDGRDWPAPGFELPERRGGWGERDEI